MLPLLALYGFASASVEVDSILTSYTSDGYVFVRLTAGNATGWGQASYNNEHADLMSTYTDKVHAWVGPHVWHKKFETMDDIDRFADGVWRANYKHTGTVLAQALAGVDAALHGSGGARPRPVGLRDDRAQHEQHVQGERASVRLER